MTANIEADIKLIRSRLEENLIAAYKNEVFPIREAKSAVELEAILEKNPETGAMRLPWLDYSNNNGSAWPLGEASQMVLSLSVYTRLSEGEEKAAAERIVIGLLRDYIIGKYVNPNWWWNEIGVPERFSKALIFAKEFLPEDVLHGALKIVECGALLVRRDIIGSKNACHTGGNLASFCIISLHHAIVVNSPEEIRLLVDALAAETYGAYEGLQPDGSFFQHGRRIYTFSYGTIYVETIANFSVILSGTSFEFPFYAKENVIRYLLDGARHMMGANSIDPLASGRHYTRPGALTLAPTIRAAKNLLKNAELPRRAEVEEMVARMESGRQPYFGMKYFPIAKLLTRHTENLYLSFKGSDPTLFGSEICTEENGLALNYSYGRITTFIRTGKEYYNVSPLLDYSYVPGTTTPEMTDAEIEALGDFTFRTVKTDTYGGASIGEVGVCFIGGENYGVTSTVAAFALPFGMVILGTDLSDKEGRALHTTVNQCFHIGDVKTENGGKEVIHGGILYKNLDENTEFKVKCEHKEYSYRRNTRVNNTPAAGDIFTLYIPKRDDYNSYAYMVCEEELRDSTVEILRNDSECQAIKIPGGRIAAVFHKTGNHTILGKEYFAVKNEVKVI